MNKYKNYTPMEFKGKFNGKILLLALLGQAIYLILATAPTALAAGAREYENPPCYDITGSTQAVIVSGVNNGGLMDFDDAGVPAAQSACVRMKADRITPDRLEGWVWNDNLGWVSLYCPGGGGALNLDIACGSQAYSVTFAATGGTAPNFTNVPMSGYAWGDNIGWISFNSGFHQMKPTASGSNRGLVAAAPAAARYTWSDAVGWQDWSGVWFHWEDTDPPMTDPNVIKYISVCSSKDTLAPYVPPTPPVAADSYGVGYVGLQDLLKDGTSLFLGNRNGAMQQFTKYSLPAVTEVSHYGSTGSYWVASEEDSDGAGTLYTVFNYVPGGHRVNSLNESTMAMNWSHDFGTDTVNDVVYDGTNSAVWVSTTNGANSYLYKLKVSDGTTLTSTPFAAGSASFMALVGTDGIVMVNSGTSITKFNRVTGSFYTGGTYAASTLVIGGTLVSLAYGNNYIWVLSDSADAVIKVNPNMAYANGTLAASTFSAGNGAVTQKRVVYDAGRNTLWITSSGLGKVSKLSAIDESQLGLYPQTAMETNNNGLVVDGANIWVTAEGAGNKIRRFDGLDNAPLSVLTAAKCTCDLDSTCPIGTDPTKVADANNTDTYDIKIPFVDAGAAVASAQIDACPASGSIDMYTLKSGVADYCAKIALQWEDDVDYDQTTAASQSQATPKFNATNTGAVTKPLNYALSGGDFSYDGVNTLWGAKVKSYAPTSDRNVTQGMQNEKFYYSDISSGYDTTKSSQNLLKLKGISLLFFKYSTSAGTPGTCIYGTINGSSCDMRNYMSTDTTLSFNPLESVPTLTNTVGAQQLNFISIASPDNPVIFHYQGADVGGAAGGVIVGTVGLQSGGSGNYRLKFVPSFPLDPADEATMASSNFNNPGPGAAFDFSGQLFSDGAGSTFDANAGPYLYTTVTYNVAAKAVKYFGAKLPRIKAGLLLNPVAKVEGNVYVTDFGQKASDVTLHSLGNISSNLRREAVVRNVAKYLNGFDPSGIVTGDKTVATGTTASINNLSILVSDANRKVFYLKGGDLTIDCGPTCAFDSNTTFIVENGSIFVNSNIVPTGNNQVGLIALRDLSDPASQKQGMLYIDGSVTWLSGVQIYLDRVVQSYDRTFTPIVKDANGFIKYPGDDDYARQGRFKNQLVFEGTISSMNGIGNASRAPATDENGTPLAAGTFCANYGGAGPVSNICRARLVDLNYQRYYGPGLEICQGSEGAGAVAGVPRDQALKAGTGNGCDPTDVAYDIDASNLYTADPLTDLVSGAGGGTPSPYFASKTPGIANEFPVNFFYKPIAKNLAGFEVDTNINPLIQN